MISQYAGEDKCRVELKIHHELSYNRKWKGQSNFILNRFVAQHRNAFVSMSQCADHVSFQLPNELSRVTYLLDAIENNDAPLQAAMALCRNDTGPRGKMSNFEDTASFLLPHDPVVNKRTTQKRSHAYDIPSAATASSASSKVGTGSTGVALRFHTRAEYMKLSSEQRDELRLHRNKLETDGKSRILSPSGGNKTNIKSNNADFTESKKFKRAVSQTVAKEVKDKQKTAETSAAEEEKVRSCILSLVNGTTTHASATRNSSAVVVLSPAAATERPSAPTLNSIISRAKRS